MGERTAEFEAFISDVERADDYPVVLTEYGFKKVDVGGKKFFMPLSKEEFIAMYARKTGESVEKVEEDLKSGHIPKCYGGGPTGQCYTQDGCYCTPYWDTAGYTCLCG